MPDTLEQLVPASDGLQVEVERRTNLKYFRYFPECKDSCDKLSLDPAKHAGLCRALYRKQTLFMEMGDAHRERMFLAANRIGKTVAAGFEIVTHMRGIYPHWWRGRRFDHAVRCWAAGDTMETTRNVPQVELLGPYEQVDLQKWTGLIPDFDIVGSPSRRSGGVAKCIDQIAVRSAFGGHSTLQFKSYDQGRRAFQGTEIEIIWLDEEPPDDVYSECLTRTITTNGLVICTFTPLQGLTPFLQQYLETSVMPDVDGRLKPANDILWPVAA